LAPPVDGLNSYVLSTLIRILASKRVALWLFAIVTISLASDTFLSPPSPAWYTTTRTIILGLLALNLTLCTIRSIKRLKAAVLLIHLGVIVVGVGALGGRLLGYVATINIFEGEGSALAYRWDLGEESRLGFQLFVKEIEQTYYPTAIKVGVVEDGRKAALFQVKTGESFSYQDLKITVKELDPIGGNLNLIIGDKNGKESTYNTKAPHHGESRQLKLVAFKTPTVKETKVQMQIKDKDHPIEAVVTTNRPLIWQGLRFFNTKIGHWKDGRAFAGIQIVKDPGIPLVYLGFAILGLGGVLLLQQKFKS